MISDSIHTRYLKQPIAVRLGGLAADLARVASVAEIPGLAAVPSLLQEGKAFIEWSAPELPIEHAARLAEIQLGLAYWHLHWEQLQNDSMARVALAQQAQSWSDEILAMSGLLTEE